VNRSLARSVSCRQQRRPVRQHPRQAVHSARRDGRLPRPRLQRPPAVHHRRGEAV